MGKKKPTDNSESDKSDFVPAVFARNVEEAEDFRALLDDHDIPAIVASKEELVETGALKAPSPRSTISRGVAVMVPEVLLDEASEVIADREDDEEFRVGDEFDQEDEDDDETAGLGIDGELEDEEMKAPLPGLVDDDDDDDEPGFLDDDDDDDDDDELDDDESLF